MWEGTLDLKVKKHRITCHATELCGNQTQREDDTDIEQVQDTGN